MVSPSDLEQYLHRHIPLTQAMRLRVASAEEEQVVLEAPLEPNINHRDTVFGGSISALATLAAWSLVHVRLDALGMRSRLVIHRNTMEYLRPISGTFVACARIEDEDDWRRFLEALRRRGKARIRVVSGVWSAADADSTPQTRTAAPGHAGSGGVLSGGGENAGPAMAGLFTGDFVALRTTPGPGPS